MDPSVAGKMIELTAEEQSIYAKINFNPKDYETAQTSCHAAKELALSLGKRRAIPRGRLEYFSNPVTFAGGRRSSRMQLFERNDASGDILAHPHFLKYLHYFIHGCDLPPGVIEAFDSEVDRRRSMFTGSDSLEVAEFARQLTRSRGLDTHKAPEEFCKLALDCGLSPDDARLVRDRVMTVR